MGLLVTQLAGELGITPDALQQALLNAGPDEALQANYLTLTPGGLIGANFTGHVHAQGLDLDAATNATPPAQDRVRWLRTDTGALVAELESYYTGTGGASSLVGAAQSQDTTDNGVAAFVALDDTGATQAQLQVTQIDRGAMPNPAAIGGNTEVDVGAGALLKRLLAADGSSHFVQLVSPQQLQLAYVNFGSFAAAAGWGTYPLISGLPFASVMMPFYSLKPANAASITSSEISSTSSGTNGFSVDVNSTVAQTINFWALAFGR